MVLPQVLSFYVAGVSSSGSLTLRLRSVPGDGGRRRRKRVGRHLRRHRARGVGGDEAHGWPILASAPSDFEQIARDALDDEVLANAPRQADGAGHPGDARGRRLGRLRAHAWRRGRAYLARWAAAGLRLDDDAQPEEELTMTDQLGRGQARARASGQQLDVQGLAAGSSHADADEQPRPRGRRAS